MAAEHSGYADGDAEGGSDGWLEDLSVDDEQVVRDDGWSDEPAGLEDLSTVGERPLAGGDHSAERFAIEEDLGRGRRAEADVPDGDLSRTARRTAAVPDDAAELSEAPGDGDGLDLQPRRGRRGRRSPDGPGQPSEGQTAERVRALDPAERVEHARSLAWKALNRRERTEAELRRLLTGKGVDEASTATVLDELREGGYVDDVGYAQRFADDKRRLDGWGSRRIAERLRTLGLDPAHIEAAVAKQDGEAELASAAELLTRRFPAGLDGPRDLARALGMLVRRGFEPETARAALRRHGGADPEGFED